MSFPLLLSASCWAEASVVRNTTKKSNSAFFTFFASSIACTLCWVKRSMCCHVCLSYLCHAACCVISCGGGVVVCVCVCSCGGGGVGVCSSGLCDHMLSVCERFKASPCVHSQRLRVCWHTPHTHTHSTLRVRTQVQGRERW